MGEGNLQTKLLIVVMVAIFIGLAVGAAMIVRDKRAPAQPRIPNPFPVVAEEQRR